MCLLLSHGIELAAAQHMAVKWMCQNWRSHCHSVLKFIGLYICVCICVYACVRLTTIVSWNYSVPWVQKLIENRNSVLVKLSFACILQITMQIQQEHTIPSIHRFNEMCIYLHSILTLHHMRLIRISDLIKMTYANNLGFTHTARHTDKCQTVSVVQSIFSVDVHRTESDPSWHDTTSKSLSSYCLFRHLQQFIWCSSCWQR